MAGNHASPALLLDKPLELAVVIALQHDRLPVDAHIEREHPASGIKQLPEHCITVEFT